MKPSQSAGMDPKHAASRVLLLESVAIFNGDLGLSRRRRNISFCLKGKMDQKALPYATDSSNRDTALKLQTPIYLSNNIFPTCKALVPLEHKSRDGKSYTTSCHVKSDLQTEFHLVRYVIRKYTFLVRELYPLAYNPRFAA